MGRCSFEEFETTTRQLEFNTMAFPITDLSDMDWPEKSLERRRQINASWRANSPQEAFDRYEDSIMGEFAGTHKSLTGEQVGELFRAIPESWTEVQAEKVVQLAIARIARGQVRVIKRNVPFDEMDAQHPLDAYDYYDHQEARKRVYQADQSCDICCTGCRFCETKQMEADEEKKRHKAEYELQLDMTDNPVAHWGSWHMLPAERYPSNAVAHELGGRAHDSVTGLRAGLAITTADLEFYIDRQLYGARHG